MIEYEELRVRLWRLAPARYLVLANGHARAVASTRIDPEVDLRGRLLALIEQELQDGGDHPGDMAETATREVGEQLFGMLFPGRVADCLAESARWAERNGRGLRLRFSLPAELCDLPLELLVAPEPHGRLVRQRRTSLVRSVRGLAMSEHRLPAPEAQRTGLRIVVVAADPEPDGNAIPQRLELDDEVAGLRELRRRVPGVAIEVLGEPGGKRASVDDLRGVLEQDPKTPTIVVVLGHGVPPGHDRAGAVVLDSPGGRALQVSARALAMAVANTASVRLVVLNLCSGAAPLHGDPRTGVGQEIVTQGVPAVVAMQTDVADRVVAHFTPTLLAALGRNDPIDEAVAAARHNMVDPAATTSVAWASPVLLLHEQCGHGWLFKVVEFADGRDTTNHHAADWLDDGQSAVATVKKPEGVLHLDTLIRASRFLRVQRRWEEAAGLIDLVPPNRDAGDELRALTDEAQCELAVDALGRFVESRETPSGTAPPVTLNDLATLPADVRAGLEAELNLIDRAAADHRELERAVASEDWERAECLAQQILERFPDGFRDTTRLRETARRELSRTRDHQEAVALAANCQWAEAEAAFEALGDYHDTPFRRWYCAGRVAENENDPQRAAECFARADGVDDAPLRLALNSLAVAERDEDWPEAARWAEEAERLGGIDPEPAAYARARMAQQVAEHDEDGWAQAESELSGLPPQYRDTRDRLPYVRGRAAAARGDWPATIEGFGHLPDDHEDGAVGRYRNWARAKVAEANADWQAVVDALRSLGDGPVVTSLRELAKGHIAAATDDWDGALAHWRAVPEPDPDLGDLIAYAQGRSAENQAQWDDALEVYDALPDDLRDVPARRNYVRGRAAEAVPDWCAAAEHYGRAPAAADATARRPYARARCALEREAWDEAAALAASLTHSEAPVLRAYASGRGAAANQRWAEAAELLDTCKGWHDAAAHASYCRARDEEEHGRWSVALAHLDGVDVADGGDRRQRLRWLLDTFPWADVLGDAMLVPDPAAAASDSYPYFALSAIGIGPDATMAEMKSAPLRALRRGDPALAEIATTMQGWERRLATDLDLYPVQDPEALRRALGGLEPEVGRDPFDALCAPLDADVPLLLLWHRRRDDAIEAWEARLAADPSDLAAAHCLAICSRWSARELDEAGALELGVVAWRRSIGCWAMVVGDDTYGEQWRAWRAATYAFRIPPSSLATVRRNVLGGLRDELEATAERHERDQRPSLAARYRRRALEVRIESVGRELLARVGGRLPIDGEGVSMVACGPLLLPQLGLTERFARLVADLVRRAEEDLTDAEATEDPAPEQLVDLRAAFSLLGPALALLNAGRPVGALASLPDLAALTITPAGAACGGPDAPRHPSPTECPECRAYLDSNPAYAFLEGREARLLQDWARLAVRGHLGTVLGLLRDAGDVGAAVDAVDAAVATGDRAGLAARTRVEVAAGVADAARAVVDDAEAVHEARVDTVISFLERVEGLRLGSHDRLQAALAEACYRRAGRLDEIQAPDVRDYESAIHDLRRAIEVRPTYLMARATLVRQLVDRARDFPEAVEPVETVAEAAAIAAEGLRQGSGHEFLRLAMTRTADLARSLVYRSMTEDELVERLQQPHGPNRNLRDRVLDALTAVADDPGSAQARDTFLVTWRRWSEPEEGAGRA